MEGERRIDCERQQEMSEGGKEGGRESTCKSVLLQCSHRRREGGLRKAGESALAIRAPTGLILWSLVASFLREGQELVAVNYYSAYATWLPREFARHRQFTAALSRVGVSTHMSDFMTRTRSCFSCGATWESHEEKQTDVRMAVDMVSDALVDNFDMAVVITADSDLGPAVE